MGWWKVQGTETLIGDLPLDALGRAVSDVAASYQAAFDRKPTKAEWEALLRAVLGNREPEWRVFEDSVAAVTIELTDGGPHS